MREEKQLENERKAGRLPREGQLSLCKMVGNQTMRQVMQRKVWVDDFPDKGDEMVFDESVPDAIEWSRTNEVSFDDAFLEQFKEYSEEEQMEEGPYKIGVLKDYLYDVAAEVGKQIEEQGEAAFNMKQGYATLMLVVEMIKSSGSVNKKRMALTAAYVPHPASPIVRDAQFPLEELRKRIASQSEYEFAGFSELVKFLYIKKRQDGAYQTDVINVGQGTSVLVSNSDAERYGLVDLGPNPVNTPDFLRSKRNKKTRPKAQGEGPSPSVSMQNVDTIITHDHADHTGGQPIPGLPPRLIGQVGGMGYEQIKGAETILDRAGGLKAAPVQGTVPTSDENDVSLITYLDTPAAVVVMPGDRTVEDIMKAQFPADLFTGKAVILVASHHGSETGTDADLLRAFKKGGATEIVVIVSAGIKNIFSHPSARELLGRRPGFSPKQGTVREIPGDETSGAEPVPYSIYSTQNMGNRRGSISVKADRRDFAVYTKKKAGDIDLSSVHTVSLPAPYGDNEAISTYGSLDTALIMDTAADPEAICRYCYFFSRKKAKLPMLGTMAKRKLEQYFRGTQKLDLAIQSFYSGLEAAVDEWSNQQAAEDVEVGPEMVQDFINEQAEISIGKFCAKNGPKIRGRECLFEERKGNYPAGVQGYKK